MNEYTMVYSNENNIHKINDELIINKLGIQQLQLDEKFFKYEISIFFIEKNLITKETDTEIFFKNIYKYIYLQRNNPYKCIIIDYIYNFDIYVNLISNSPLNNTILSHIKKKIQHLTKQIQSIEFKKINKIESININNFDIDVLFYLITQNTFNIKENELIMESIYKKISVTPMKIKVLYRGVSDIDILNHDIESKYVSTSINPLISSYFTGDTCCFQILYNLDIPYIILNDSEQEYILHKNFYYHKIHVDHIYFSYKNNKVKCVHYIISLHKLTRSEINELKTKINLNESLVNLYKLYIKNLSNYKYDKIESNVLHIKDNAYTSGYYNWSHKFYKQKYKSLTEKEVNTIVSWKSSSMNINSYSYMNLSLFYTIIYELNNTSPLDKKREIDGFKNKIIPFRRDKIINDNKKYYIDFLEDKKNNNKVIIHPGIYLKKYNNFTCIYHPGGIIHIKSDNIHHLYPNNVEIKKNEIYFGNKDGVFDYYIY